jgi:hypothetical protein
MTFGRNNYQIATQGSLHSFLQLMGFVGLHLAIGNQLSAYTSVVREVHSWAYCLDVSIRYLLSEALVLFQPRWHLGLLV